jgi:hypothetical protein
MALCLRFSIEALNYMPKCLYPLRAYCQYNARPVTANMSLTTAVLLFYYYIFYCLQAVGIHVFSWILVSEFS